MTEREQNIPGDYYEEMEVPVVYERDNPKNNLPVGALYDEYEVSVKQP